MTCQIIEAEIDQVLEFLENVTTPLSAFPPGWNDRDLVHSQAAVACLALTCTMVSVLLLLFLWENCGRRLVKRLFSRTLTHSATKSIYSASANTALLQLDEESPLLQQQPLFAFEPRDVACENLRLRLSDGTVVLDGVYATFKSGTTTAILGPSGSGKTSFLTALAGRATYAKTTGRTLVNGTDVNLQRLKRSIGFVPQHDIMFHDLTVEETLKFSAYCRLDPALGQQRMKIVEETLVDLQLSEIRGSRVGNEHVRGISGGQKKRVNLGIEMVCMPSILLLDEPTSGLDSSGSFEMAKALRELAKKKLTIVAIVHQPSWQLISLFDNILLLSKGGKTAFSGPVTQMQPYFESLGFVFPKEFNPVDVALDAVTGVLKSSDSSLKHYMLPQLWKQRISAGSSEPVLESINWGESLWEKQAPGDDLNSSSGNATNGNGSGTFERASSGSSGNLTKAPRNVPVAQMLPDQVGERWTGLLAAIITFFMPPLVLVPFHFAYFRTRLNQYGAFFGFSVSSILVACLLPSLYASYTFLGSPGEIVVFVVFCAMAGVIGFHGLIALFALFYCYGRGVSVACGAHYMFASLLGPLSFPVASFVQEKLRYSMLLGYGVLFVCLGVAIGTGLIIVALGALGPHQVPGDFWSSSSLLVSQVMLAGLPTIGFCLIAVGYLRWKRIPSTDRKVGGFFRQSWQNVVRAFRQYIRNVFGVALDLMLPFLTGVSVGVLSLGKVWVPPFTATSEWAANATRCIGCGDALSRIPLRIDAMCKLLQLNYDPFPPIGLMSTMGIGLCACTSALRLFSEKSVFTRESRSGLSTEAHYLGRSIVHFGASLAAVLCFTVPFYWLVAPHAPFGLYFALYLLVYLCCAGVGLWLSVLLDSALAGIMSILLVLSFVLFGGSLFIAGVAMPSLQYPLEFGFFVLSNLSPMRWSYELFWLITMDPYIPYLEDKRLSFGYTTYGFSFDHYAQGWLALGLLTFLFRAITYTALVAKEGV